MLSNKLFSFKPVVIFFSKKKGWGGGLSFKERISFHFAGKKKKKKKMSVSWSIEAGAQSSCDSYPAKSKIVGMWRSLDSNKKERAPSSL